MFCRNYSSVCREEMLGHWRTSGAPRAQSVMNTAKAAPRRRELIVTNTLFSQVGTPACLVTTHIPHVVVSHVDYQSKHIPPRLITQKPLPSVFLSVHSEEGSWSGPPRQPRQSASLFYFLHLPGFLLVATFYHCLSTIYLLSHQLSLTSVSVLVLR